MLIETTVKEDIIRYVKKSLGAIYQVPLFCAIFGSWVYGTARLDSDYDVYVVCKSLESNSQTIKLI